MSSVQWQPPEILSPDGIRSDGISGSSDGGNIIIQFDDFGLVLPTSPLLDGTSALSASRVTTLRIPLTVSEDFPFLGYVQDLRGFVQKSKGARVVIVAETRGGAEVIEFPYDGDFALPPVVPTDDLGSPLFPPGPPDDSRTDDEKGRNFLRRFFSEELRPGRLNTSPPAPELPPHPPYTITLLLSIHLRTAADSAVVQVDNLDLTLLIDRTDIEDNRIGFPPPISQGSPPGS